MIAVTEKFSHVLVMTRVEGKCHKEHFAMRYAKLQRPMMLDVQLCC